jgi:3-oxoacyl-[acyl-carrier protein] reductase
MMTSRSHALVTGTSSGIGGEIARRLLAEGWCVTGVARRDPGIVDNSYTHVIADLATSQGADAAAAAAKGVTAFVHAAGFMATGELGDLDAGASDRMWRLHVAAAERIANGLSRRLVAGGRIVLIGSRTASGAAGRSQYAATKAALVAIARSWAIELAGRGITVNVVAPAATETPMLADPARAGVPPKLPPIGRYIQPEEVAAAVSFLLSAEAAAITGQTLTICGGSSL